MSEITEIDGIGAATEERLSDAGVNDIEDLAQATIEDLTEYGVSERKAEKLITRASERAILVQTGDDVVNEYDDKEYVGTGMEVLDDMLGGGYKEGDVVGITGKSDSGKTQLTFESMVTAVEETGDPAVYIETEKDNYQPERIQALANEPDTQSKIYRIKAHGEDALEKQLNSYSKIQKLVNEKDDIDGISLVAVDSFNARFRIADKYDGRGELAERSTEIGAHLRGIEEMVHNLNCPIILTLQIYGNPSQYGANTQFYGGQLLNHMKSYLIKMKEAKGSMKKLEMSGHPGQSDGEMHISIRDTDLVGMRDD